jgi:tetratricopeptide (TPR) repeat protein
MVRAGLADESGAKLIEQRGVDFAPTEDFLQSLKSAGANEAFLSALRGAKPAEAPAQTIKNPLNQVQVFALLAGQVPSHRVAVLVGERGIDFEPTDEYLREIGVVGGEDELINGLKSARVIKPQGVELELRTQYVRDEMWDEALGSLKVAVSKQQFDPVLRLALGEALFRTRDYEQAIPQLNTAKKLDAGLWQATQRMADAHLKLWELKKSLPDRVLASDLYHELLSSVSVSDPNNVRLAALFPNWRDKTSADTEAQSALAKLESPMGTWVSEMGELYIFRGGSDGWSLQALHPKAEGAVSAFSTTPPSGNTLPGQGAWPVGFCTALLSIEIRLAEHATKMELAGWVQASFSQDGEPSREAACRKLPRTARGMPAVQLKLVRSQ